MPHDLDYARPTAARQPSTFRAAAPRNAALALAAFISLAWLAFFTFGGVAAVDTHFTSRPQLFPAFRLTPWQPAPAEPGAPPSRLTRDAIYPLTLRTLRYRQVTDDRGATVETVHYDADIRWGPTSAGLLVTALLPPLAFFSLRRLLR